MEFVDGFVELFLLACGGDDLEGTGCGWIDFGRFGWRGGDAAVDVQLDVDVLCAKGKNSEKRMHECQLCANITQEG